MIILTTSYAIPATVNTLKKFLNDLDNIKSIQNIRYLNVSKSFYNNLYKYWYLNGINN